MSLCIIPARGGSKRIPRKNIRIFRGLPMIAWSIRAAKQSECFDRILVSTDDHEIASIASEYGAEVPFIRPPELSNDFAGTQDVIIHAINELGNEISPKNDVCCIYATAPFASPYDLVQAKSLLLTSRANSLVYAVTTFPFPIQRSVRIDSDGYSSAFNPLSISMRSQDLEEAYHDTGQFYWASQEVWKQSVNLFDGARPLVLPRWRVQDIDTEEDWKRAELLHAMLNL